MYKVAILNYGAEPSVEVFEVTEQEFTLIKDKLKKQLQENDIEDGDVILELILNKYNFYQSEIHYLFSENLAINVNIK